MRFYSLIFSGLLIVMPRPGTAEELHVAGAGSLSAALTEMVARFPSGADSVAKPVFGPSGLMREKIAAEGSIDLFASANMAHARSLAAGYPDRTVINFTRNSLCALAREQVGLTQANFLDRLLDPAVRIATSTPGADPGGDYAWAMFARADALRPGARATLEAKAQKLVGGGAATPLLVPGKGPVEGVFISGKADIMLGYCSSAGPITRVVPGLAVVPVPPGLAVDTPYGMVLMNAKPVTLRFAAFVMSEAGQALLKAHGFDPVALPEPGPPAAPGLLVQRAGKPSQTLSPAQIAALPRTSQKVQPEQGHGDAPVEWTGPMLWDVLVAAGAADPAKPAEQVRQMVRVVAQDGYVVVLALAELSPQFAGKPIQLVDTRNAAPIPGNGLRLVVPGERRAGRSARDVVRIDVE